MIDHEDRKETNNHIYLNINIQPSSGPATYNETRPQKIVEKGSDYQLAINRFTVPWGNLPLLIFRIEEGDTQTDPNLGLYKFTLTYNGDDFTENAIFSPVYAAPVPRAPSQNNGAQDKTEYYYIYTFSRLVSYFNDALAAAFVALKATYPGAPQTEPPYFIVKDRKLNLIYPRNYNTSGNEISIKSNVDSSAFFDGVEYIYDENATGKEVIFILDTLPNFDDGYAPFGTTPTTPPIYIKKTAEFSSIPGWSEVKTLIFNTSLIPVRQEYIASSANEGRNTVRPILTDFDVSGWDGKREPIKFFTTSPYRYIDILTDQPIQSLNLSLLWQDKDENIRPIILFEPANIKLAFVKKYLTS